MKIDNKSLYLESFEYVDCPNKGNLKRCCGSSVQYDPTKPNHIKKVDKRVFLKIFKNPRKCLFPLIKNDKYVKPYFDVDYEIRGVYSEEIEKEMRIKYLGHIKHTFPNKDISISTNHRFKITKGIRVFKYSFHFIVQGIRTFVRDLKGLSTQLKRLGCDRIDTSVYREGINKFRFGNQIKEITDETIPIIDSPLENYLIHDVKEDDTLYEYKQTVEFITKNTLKMKIDSKREKLITEEQLEISNTKLETNWKKLLIIKEIKHILMNIPIEYSVDYNKWLSILFSCKDISNNVLMFEAFDDFSRRSPNKYDYNNNLKIWNRKDRNIDFGKMNISRKTLFALARDHKIKYNINLFQKMKSFNDIKDIKHLNIETHNFNQKRVSNADIDINTDDIILVKSPTGSGKTYFMENVVIPKFKDCKIISLTSRRSMASYLSKVCNVESYLNSNDQENGFVCGIDSLEKLIMADSDEKYIVLLDEVNSLFEHILDTIAEKTINNRLLYIKKLFNLIHYSECSILVDADLSTKVIKFIKNNINQNLDVSEDIKKMKLYINDYKPMKQPPVYRYNKMNKIEDSLYHDIYNNKYFFCGSDYY